MKQEISFLLLLVLLLILNSCKENSNPNGPSLNQTLLFNGQISNWNLGSNYRLKFALLTSDSHYNQYLGDCIISSTGSFSISPTTPPDSLIYLSPYNPHPGTITVSDTSVRFSYTATFVVYSDSSKSIVGTLIRENYPFPIQDPTGWFNTIFIFATGDVNIKGYYLGYNYNDTVTCNLEFKKGGIEKVQKLCLLIPWVANTNALLLNRMEQNGFM